MSSTLAIALADGISSSEVSHEACESAVIRKAVHPDPYRRHGEVSEFAHALRSARDEGEQLPSLMERNPLLVWKVLCAILAVANLVQLARR